jgi:hypothetical protein
MGRSGNEWISSKYLDEILAISLLLLPIADFVFFVRQNVTDVAPLAVEMDHHDEAILISSDVEYDELTNLICAAENLSNICEILPAGCFNGFNPMP